MTFRFRIGPQSALGRQLKALESDDERAALFHRVVEFGVEALAANRLVGHEDPRTLSVILERLERVLERFDQVTELIGSLPARNAALPGPSASDGGKGPSVGKVILQAADLNTLMDSVNKLANGPD